MAFETIRRERERLIALLLTTPDPVLDEVASLGIVTEEEYEALEKLSEPRERIRRLLIKIQRKGEHGCEQFLECLQSLFPDFLPDLQPPARRCVTRTNDAENPESGTSSKKNEAENPQDAVTLGKNELENPGGATSLEKNDLENPETALPHEENDLGNSDGSPSSGKIDPQNSEDATSSEKNDPEKLEEPEKAEAVLSSGKGLVTPNSATTPIKNEPENSENALPSKNDPESPGGARSSEKDAAAVSSERADFKGSGNIPSHGEGKTAEGKGNIEDGVTPDSDVSMPESRAETPGVAMSVERSRAETRGDAVSVDRSGSEVPETFPNKFHAGRRGALKTVLSKLRLKKFRNQKLRLRDLLQISPECLKDSTPYTFGDLPWHFLRKLMALNGTARSTSLWQGASDEDTSEDEEGGMRGVVFSLREDNSRASLHPLDVLCAVLICSDSFLQQEILSKMSMCQFALPLLLPALNTSKCTLMLWAMRDIVRKWRPHSLAQSRGFREESLVLTSMPTVSFVRMGSCSFSKSKLLNEVLSPSQQHHDFFIHRDMDSGNVPREIADGLVEISWYFPAGRENLDLFPEPIAVTNLRGDIESQWLQFSFLTEISSAVFILTESISEREYMLLSSLQGSATKYYFILNNQSGKAKETVGLLNILAPLLDMKKSQLLVKEQSNNSAELVKKLQSTLQGIITSSPKSMSIQNMAVTARELGIQVEEDSRECRTALEHIKEITAEIQDVAKYKREMLRLQGDLWKSLAEVEKELCRMKGQWDVPLEDYRSQLRQRWLELRRQQNQCDLTSGMVKFISGIGQLRPAEKHHFLKWMKFHLDHIARGNLSRLRTEYKEKCCALGDDAQQLAELDELICASSLGVEHFMRELGQFYEAECSMVKEGNMGNIQRQFIHLPGIAADLMLEGFPMELIDGDASNIPLQWVTDVLTELHAKLGGRSRMLVLTVLGVQSTGKSTLLNTMFGLQFAVSSGRCTRGAFMSLIKVAENFRQDLGCDFILVIDTEGLKAPELAKLEDSYEHDNELATLVIGLSDITIVNMAMENATEMKDVLQIVVHSFLRMEEIGHKPNCQFVHQNVSDVSAYEQNMRDRKHLLEQLDEMTKAAARMEKQSREMKFSDIMDYDPEKHSWYIPGLWHGVPPMAPVNMGYSESVCELKKYLFEFMRNRSPRRAPKDIPQFIKWVGSLWNAVKHENFIFSFRNSLVAEAYTQLSVMYAVWEWDFRKEMHLWMSKAETTIQNESPDDLGPDTFEKLRLEVHQMLHSGEQKMQQSLQSYFESGTGNLHLVEKYREDFLQSVTFLRHELESYLLCKSEEAIRIQKGRSKIDHLQARYMKTIEGKVNRLLQDCRERDKELKLTELQREFAKMWKETLAELPLESLPLRQIHKDIHYQLCKDLENRGSLVKQMLHKAQSLLTYQSKPICMKKEYMDLAWYKVPMELITQQCWHELEEFTKSLVEECRRYVRQKVHSQGDYDQTYCRELLWMINERLQEKIIGKMSTSASFEVDLKLHILGEAASAFQKMHEDFLKKNDPQHRLEELRPQYFSTFRDVYYEKDACQKRAFDFCDRCLRPALWEYMKKRLGIEIVDNFLSSGECIEYGSRSFFQFTVQKKLLEEMDFSNYVKYINNYEVFIKSWIQTRLFEHYRETGGLKELERVVLATIMKKIQNTLESSECQDALTVSEFLDHFCQVMCKELVISKDSLEVILFKNTASVRQFSADINTFLPQVEEGTLSEWEELSREMVFTQLQFKPQDEIFKRVFGCGKQCPFCNVPCEAGGSDHKEHFASVHRPQGLGRYKDETSKRLIYSLCSSDVVSSLLFRNLHTAFQWHPYKDYRQFYPTWRIQPDPSINASDYWKFIFKKFNHQFAKEYKADPADLPTEWKKITKKQALQSIQEAFNIE
ncbi:interferon-induced very large GTPase 1-like isoform X2 [Dermochelys coriacea]|nr:interferon-induced very large GTPase 1-like isoform X2 [Dermochelys coriacea]XP_043373098.1 interferon-induced very large GTPase 1-like isoform X2 [Dermochelys coriacea]XP_043373099.1 interferon-induced very large GTPase 1-like isoform X2 [Dermochelys coriacea]